MEADPSLAELVPGSEEVTKAEVVHAIETEGALKAEDLWLRRTEMGTLGKVADEAKAYCEAALTSATSSPR